MALPGGDLVNYRVGGAMGGDTWSIGWWVRLLGLTAIPTPTQANNDAQNCLTDFNTTVWTPAGNPLAARNAPACTLLTATAHYYHDTVLTITGNATGSVQPGTSATPVPAYCARVVTLQTGLAGRANRGRVYLPATGATVNSGTLLYVSWVNELTNLASFFTTKMNAAHGSLPGSPTGAVSVVSRTHTTDWPVIALRMDNKPDTQHGRESKIAATVFDTHSV